MWNEFHTNHTATELEYAVSIKTILELYNIDFSEIDGAIISSVVPTVTITMKRAIKKITGCDAMIIGPGIKTGLSIVIDNPRSSAVTWLLMRLREYMNTARRL